MDRRKKERRFNCAAYKKEPESLAKGLIVLSIIVFSFFAGLKFGCGKKTRCETLAKTKTISVIHYDSGKTVFVCEKNNDLKSN